MVECCKNCRYNIRKQCTVEPRPNETSVISVIAEEFYRCRFYESRESSSKKTGGKLLNE